LGAHAKWTRDEEIFPKKPEVRTEADVEREKREQEEREDEFYAEEERRRERFERGDMGPGRWAGKRGGGRGGGGARAGYRGRRF
jgi:cleavage and polyadenylation specificity factor subunit 4